MKISARVKREVTLGADAGVAVGELVAEVVVAVIPGLPVTLATVLHFVIGAAAILGIRQNVVPASEVKLLEQAASELVKQGG